MSNCQTNKEGNTPLEILKSNIAMIKSDIVFDTILQETKSIRKESQNIQFLLDDTDEGIGLLNTAPHTKLYNFISKMLSEKTLFDSNVNLLKISKKKLENPIILQKVEEAASIICSLKTIPFCNCKPQKLKIIRETSEMAQETLVSFFISYESILRRIIKDFQSSSKGELKLHTDFYQALYQPLKFIKELRYFLRGNKNGGGGKPQENSDKTKNNDKSSHSGTDEDKWSYKEPIFPTDHKKECPLTVGDGVLDSTLNLYVKTSREIYTSEFVRHFETIYDVIQNYRIRQGFNLNLLLESVFLIRDGEMEFLKNAFEIQNSEKTVIFIQESLFDPLIDTIIQFIIDLYLEYKKDVLLMIWDVGNLLEKKYLCKRNLTTSSDQKRKNILEKRTFIAKMLSRLLECYANLLKEYIKVIQNKLKNRRKHRKVEILKEQILSFSDIFVKKVFLTILHDVISEMRENGLEIFYEMEEEYTETFKKEDSTTRIFRTPEDTVEMIPFDLKQFQKEVEEHFDRAISQGSTLSSKNPKINERIKQFKRK